VINNNQKLELFIVHLKKKYQPKSILIAITAIAALQTTLSQPSYYNNLKFPCINNSIAVFKKLVKTREVTKEESKPPPLTDEQINTAFCNLPNTPAGVQVKLYLISTTTC
jgi:hypothetical protein